MDFNTYKKTVNSTLDSIDVNEVKKFVEILTNAYYEEKLIFIIGNGGSAANASHFAQDLAKGTRTSREQPLRLKALSLTDNSPFITAQGNDEGYESIFEQQLRTFAKPGDLLIAISGSGNSPNIIKAVEWANANKLITIGITAFNGGTLKKLSNYNVHVPLNDMCTSESIHSVIFHYIILELREKLNK
jgi:D-sedoheptulose 7-phosphate isomerase